MQHANAMQHLFDGLNTLSPNEESQHVSHSTSSAASTTIDVDNEDNVEAISNSTDTTAATVAAAGSAAAFHVGVSVGVDSVARAVVTTNSTAANPAAPPGATATTSTLSNLERDQVSLKRARFILAQNDKGNENNTGTPILVTTGKAIDGETQHI